MVDELKAQAYDMERKYAEFKKEMDRIIKEAEAKAASYGEETKVEENAVNPDEQVELPVVEEQVPVEEQAEAPVIEEQTPVEEQAEAPVVEEQAPVEEQAEAPVVEEQAPVEEKVEVPVVEEQASVGEQVEVPVVENVPLIQPGVGPQTLDQTPLTPVGIEIPSVEENKEVYEKTDLNQPKMISTTAAQNTNLRASKEAQKGLVFEEQATVENTPVVETPAPAVVTEVNPTGGESLEDIQKEMQAMVNELSTTTDEARANELNNNISMLNEKVKTLTKTA